MDVGTFNATDPIDGDNAAADGASNSSAGAENELANTGVPATVPLVALAASLLALLDGVLMARGRVQRRH
ncbi:hypothetical protein DWB68_07130 [Galactobacter valiniphilus]|uniref:LPXTG cell wall anchor domain-containing protein n=1 Tax=Galactobacter valiniphilus TaxID=2676122 RepID=A0A399JAA3_9MICC|nr:hypothetical protein [Galactobacter valiniphilus]RII42513.1 hypothetical protein DWB68_07130 [Galactobacter valiniphilus]